MPYDTPAIAALAVALVLASVLGLVAHRLKLPPLPAYLLAGLVVGPHVLNLAGSPALGGQLAEFGIILLMFGVGLHVSLRDLRAIRLLPLFGSLAQLILGTLLGLGLALLLGWSMLAGLLFGLALSVASSVLVLQAAGDKRHHRPVRDDSAIGWLVVQNLVVVLALLLLPTIANLDGTAAVIYDPFVSLVERLLGTSVGLWGALALTLLKLAAFIGFMLVAGHSVIPWLLRAVARMGSRELFRLAIVAIALILALGAAWLFGVSLALGAFLAGMILNEGGSLGRAARQTLPLRDAFAVLFFVAVGMLFDPHLFLSQPLPLLATLLIVMLGKSFACFAVMTLFRRPVADALGLSARLAQIGEFSFVLVSAGVALALLPPEALGLVLAAIMVSILLNPLLFWGASLLQPRIEARMADHDHRVEPVHSPAPPVPEEPRLPPTDNLLARAAAPAAAVAVEAAAPQAPLAAEVTPEPAEPETPEAPEPEPLASEPETPAPEDTGSTLPTETVIILPSPEPAAEETPSEAPAPNEQPPTIDAIVVHPEPEASEPETFEPEATEPESSEEPAASEREAPEPEVSEPETAEPGSPEEPSPAETVIILPPPEPEPPEPSAEAEPPEPVPETEQQPSEPEPVEPENESETAPIPPEPPTEDTQDEDKPDEPEPSAPPVVPEPKN